MGNQGFVNTERNNAIMFRGPKLSLCNVISCQWKVSADTIHYWNCSIRIAAEKDFLHMFLWKKALLLNISPKYKR